MRPRSRLARARSSPFSALMILTVFHYHFRPGGVREVIARGLPALVRAAGIRRVIMASGECPPEPWREELEAALHPLIPEWRAAPALSYRAEQSSPAGPEETAALLTRLVPPGGVLWAHNLSVGRNLGIAQAVAALPENRTVWLHHHDWWWDGRWERWPEIRAQGLASLAAAVAATLPLRCRHFCINAADARLLRTWAGLDACFVPNPVTVVPPGPEETAAARDFLHRHTGNAPAWVYPCRGLRRKNIAEALLVQRWLDPGAVTVTTGGPSSAGETAYCTTLAAAAARHGWPLFTGVCTGPDAPGVPGLTAAARTLAVTSLREGFGLPYHEAAAAARPLMARIPGGLGDTLHGMGLTLQNAWDRLLIPAAFAGPAAACLRDQATALEAQLPPELRDFAILPDPVPGEALDFGSLPLCSQLEVLAAPQDALRRGALALNPVLREPRTPQQPGRTWTAEDWAAALLSGAAAPSLLSPVPDFASRAPRYLAPLVRRWIRHPLLWPEPPPP